MRNDAPQSRTPNGLTPSDFEKLGPFAPAGLRATELALERAARSGGQGRVPIAGAAVLTREDGTLDVLAVGNNGRVPPPDRDGVGYPTDHGETGTIRQIADVAGVDWSRVVFTTTLSPCIMCTRTLIHLYHLGLDKIVIAEARSFPGKKEMLARLPGMTLVELTNEGAVRMMGRFSRTWPWDWAADIGEIPPADLAFAEKVEGDRALQRRLLEEVSSMEGGGAKAGVVSSDGTVLATARDERGDHGENPTMSAPMISMGRAGSAVNLRECVLAYASADASTPLTADAFGASSLGACELFRPAVVLSDAEIDDELRADLEEAGVKVLSAGR